MEKAEVVHAFPKSPEEEIRFTLRQYKDRHYVDVRLWFQPSNGGDYHPTKKGITVSLEYLAELRKGFERAGKLAHEWALQNTPKPVK